MSYGVLPTRTPHVPVLDFDRAVIVYVSPSDVPKSDIYTFTSVYNDEAPFSGMIGAFLPATWNGRLRATSGPSEDSATNNLRTQGFQSASGQQGIYLPISNGVILNVQMLRTTDSTTNARLVFIPWKGETVPTQGGDS